MAQRTAQGFAELVKPCTSNFGIPDLCLPVPQWGLNACNQSLDLQRRNGTHLDERSEVVVMLQFLKPEEGFQMLSQMWQPQDSINLPDRIHKMCGTFRVSGSANDVSILPVLKTRVGHS